MLLPNSHIQAFKILSDTERLIKVPTEKKRVPAAKKMGVGGPNHTQKTLLHGEAKQSDRNKIKIK